MGLEQVLRPDRAEAHLEEATAPKKLASGNTANTRKQVGTGPFKYGGGAGGSQTLQWNRREGWWATKALGKRMPMKHIVDIHNTSNTASLQNFLQNKIDLSNNFFPGINRYGWATSARTTGGRRTCSPPTRPGSCPIRQRRRLNDPVFRRALAESININRIVDGRLRET